MGDRSGLRLPSKGYQLFNSLSGKVFVEGIWHNNPIFGMMLGLCSTLAVTNLLSTSLVMSLAVIVILLFNSLIISVIRNLIPEKVRMVTYMLIISTLVITVDLIIKVFLPDISRALGPYVALIITNCILMGRAEAFASNNPPLISAADALGVGLGYAFSLLTLGFFRELIGFGTLFGVQVIPQSIGSVRIFSIPPGAFFALAIFILAVNRLKRRSREKGGK